MPQIIVQAQALDGTPGVVTMAERAVPTRQQNDHYIAQLIERVGWAVLDAERLESQSIMSDPVGPASCGVELEPALTVAAVARASGERAAGDEMRSYDCDYEKQPTIRKGQ